MSDGKLDHLPLGKPTDYSDSYTPSLIQGITRETMREPLGIDGETLPFKGADAWTGYELSWLNKRGRPEVAAVRILVPVHTPRIFESKSLKLYLGSFSQTQFASRADVQRTMESDLRLAARAPVIVQVIALEQLDTAGLSHVTGVSLDTQEIDVDEYQVNPELLTTHGDVNVRETLFTHLLRSRCPVTGQPDWGTLWIQYAGPPIDHAGLLRYVISFRNHQGFHEETVERIFMDIQRRCAPTTLSVQAFYLRRGGLEINPYRSSKDDEPQA
ncbi:MAG TPA: NADPH-dependent 7-cyano-7-deazaguanine reductase QueF, partial [Pseudomonadales bacterium]|nr:NADPH-dependent 7-cyano-7-deazaguanine reductase QueF [Pseudomonadales bacterium]